MATVESYYRRVLEKCSTRPVETVVINSDHELVVAFLDGGIEFTKVDAGLRIFFSVIDRLKRIEILRDCEDDTGDITARLKYFKLLGFRPYDRAELENDTGDTLTIRFALSQ